MNFSFKENEIYVFCIIIFLFIIFFFKLSIFIPTDSAKIVTAEQYAKSMTKSIKYFHRDCKQYLKPEIGFGPLFRNPGIPEWNGPYISARISKDPWGSKYEMGFSNNIQYVFSIGPDLTLGTSDDIK